MYKARKMRGWITFEVIAGITLLGLISGAFAVTMNQSGKLNRIQLTRQQCLAAASAELDSLTVTGERIDPKDFARLWPRLGSNIAYSSGTGQWKGLRLVKVTVTGRAGSKEVKIELSRYLNTTRKLTQ
jgi:hypothetical protein